jgi:hypothetical protein
LKTHAESAHVSAIHASDRRSFVASLLLCPAVHPFGQFTSMEEER